MQAEKRVCLWNSNITFDENATLLFAPAVAGPDSIVGLASGSMFHDNNKYKHTNLSKVSVEHVNAIGIGWIVWWDRPPIFSYENLVILFIRDFCFRFTFFF
jgi:hypothetical protein